MWGIRFFSRRVQREIDRSSRRSASIQRSNVPVTHTEDDGRGDGYLGHASGRAHRRHRSSAAGQVDAMRCDAACTEARDGAARTETGGFVYIV